MKIEIWSDIACPWCFIGKRRFESALAVFPHRDEVEVLWRSYQLDPALPEHYDGTAADYLGSRKGLPADRIAGMFEHVAAQAAAEGLAYDFGKVVVANSFTAHRFLHFARRNAAGGAAKEALLSAHFEQGLDIGDTETIVALASGLGLDEAETRAVLAGDAFAEDVRKDIADARAIGVQGVPFFVIDRKYAISGAQPAEVFSEALHQAWREANPLTMVGAGTADGEVCGPEGC